MGGTDYNVIRMTVLPHQIVLEVSYQFDAIQLY
jgi:hypothetical protein